MPISAETPFGGSRADYFAGAAAPASIHALMSFCSASVGAGPEAGILPEEIMTQAGLEALSPATMTPESMIEV